MTRPLRIWLDMANSPHPVLFRSLAEELTGRGHDLLVTTRDHGQTRELTLAVWPQAAVIGEESPGSRLSKARNIVGRVAGLRRHVAGAEPDVAVSLNSYAQIVTARLTGIPAVTLMDYEYQPANHLSFRLARRVVVPSAFPLNRLRRYGARSARVVRFDGFKEELYLDREPGPVGAAIRSDGRTRVLFRPPAEGALYHPGANEAFDRLVRDAAARDDVGAIVLPRLAAQRSRYAGIPGATVLDSTVDGIALLRSADVFIGAGGTMSREAALLGVRAYTVFAGRLPAVDEALIRSGRLGDLRSLDGAAVDWSARDRDEVVAAVHARRQRGAHLRAWLADVIEREVRLY